MNKFVSFFNEASLLKLIVISVLIGGLATFLEKAVPSIFLGLRLIAFVLFVYAVIRFLNKK